MLQPSPNVIAEVLDDEVVMIDLLHGIYYNVKGSGAVAWRCVVAGANTDQICQVLAGGAEVDPEMATAVGAFVAQLVSEGLVTEVTDSTTEVEGVSLPVVDPATTFDPPVLERFDDMANVLLADPIHDVDPDKGWPSKQ